jgi:hypothetical protein
VGSRGILDGCGKFRRHRDSIPGPYSPWLVAVPTELTRPTQSLINECLQIADFITKYYGFFMTLQTSRSNRYSYKPAVY